MIAYTVRGGRLGRMGSIVCAATLAMLVGCETGELGHRSVDDAWVAPQSFRGSSPKRRDRRPPTRRALRDAIAVVDGRPIARAMIVDLLLEAHGVGLLEQLIVLERAEQMAADVGVVVAKQDIEVEHERSIEKLMGRHATDTSPELRRRAGETLLDEVLSQRNISRAEFALVTRRNAILRKIALHDMQFDEEQLRQEHARLYGDRAEIRHIQVASANDAERILRQLDAGVTFAELAKLYSVNRASGEMGGVLPPFLADDADVPEVLRRTAFALSPGERSGPIHIDQWFHVIQLDKRIPAKDVLFATVRGDLEHSLRERAADAAMQELYIQLFNDAKIEVLDPKLRSVFFKKHAEHKSAPTEVTRR